MPEQFDVENSAIHASMMLSLSSKKPMVWTDKHNEIFVAEMYLHEPWKQKKGSKERRNVWDVTSESLNRNDHPKFAVSLKSVRDHYNHLKEHRRKIREKEKRLELPQSTQPLMIPWRILLRA